MTEQTWDVIVAGAGAAGVPAAVSAARRGAKTLLLEQRPAPGGTMTAGLGFPVCGLFENDTTRPPRLLNAGLSEEFFSAVCAVDSDPAVAMGRVYICRCSANLFQRISEDWLARARVAFLPNVQNLQVEEGAGKISALRFRVADGPMQTAVAGQVIDCTGNGAVVQESSAERIEPQTLPLSGFSVRLRGVDADDLLPVKVPYELRHAADAGTLPAWCRFTFFSPGVVGCNDAFCKFSPPANCSVAQVRETVRCALEILKKRLPAFQAAELVETSSAVLLREGVRLKGGVVLCEEDILAGRTVADPVARGAWPMEYWDAENGPQFTFAPDGSSYEISARCLRSVNVKNLIAAGRCLSASSAALSSARVIGTAIATGEAVGRLAVERLL